MLHISDLKKFQFCESYYHYSLSEPINPFFSFFPLDININELLIKRLNIKEYFKGETGDNKDLALKAIKTYKWLFNARFEANGLRNQVPLLKVTPKGVFLYYFYKGSLPKKHLKFHLTALMYLLKENDINVKGISVLYLNSNYVYQDELNLNELILETKYFYNKNNNKEKVSIFKQITDGDYKYIASLVKRINNFNIENIHEEIARKCFISGECPYFKKCFQDYDIKDNSILHLHGTNLKYDLLKKGSFSLSDYYKTDAIINKNQYAQIKADLNKGLYYERLPIMMWLKRLEYPLSFLDFEWETTFIPSEFGIKPFTPRVFQYSLKVLNETLNSYDYLSIEINELDLIENLINDLPKTSSIITFNGEGAESARLKELGERYQQYQNVLTEISERIIDIASIFNEGYLYDLKMTGGYSLSNIVKAFFPKHSYDKLNINDGYQAVLKWRSLKLLPTEKQNEVIEDLKKYCGHDTYTLYLLYKYLNEIIK